MSGNSSSTGLLGSRYIEIAIAQLLWLIAFDLSKIVTGEV